MADETTRFFEHLDRPLYEQPLVPGITGATLNDLVGWRRRGLIQAESVEPRRVVYRGREVLRIAVMRELAWAIGPGRASVIGGDLFLFFDRLAKEGVEQSLYDYLVALRPEGAHESARPAYLRHFDDSTISDDTSVGMPWFIVNRGDLDLESTGHAAIVVPLGRVLLRTSIRAAAMIGER